MQAGDVLHMQAGNVQPGNALHMQAGSVQTEEVAVSLEHTAVVLPREHAGPSMLSPSCQDEPLVAGNFGWEDIADIQMRM